MRIRVPYLTTGVADDLVITLYLAPLWWVLGLSIFVYHGVTLLLLMKMILTHIKSARYIALPKIVFFLILLFLVYSFSLVLNYAQSDASRVIASLYNLSFWFMGCVVITAIYNSFDRRALSRLISAMRFNIIIIGSLAVAALLIWMLGYHEVRFATPFLRMFPWIESYVHLKASATMELVTTDWFAGSALPRISILSPYPAALAAFLVLCIPLVYAYSFDGERVPQSTRVVATTMGIIAFLLTLARADSLAILLAIFSVYVLTRKHSSVWVIAILCFLVIAYPFIVDFVTYVSATRSGSTKARFAVYYETLAIAWRENPFVGIGVKPRVDEMKIPLGSHSTYLSLLLKTGFIGLAAFILFQVWVFTTWLSLVKSLEDGEWKKNVQALGISLIAAALVFFFEDLDAPPLTAFMYFTLVGVLTFEQRTVIQRTVMLEQLER